MARWLDIGQVTVLGQHAAILVRKEFVIICGKKNFFLKAGSPDWVKKAYKASHNY